MQAWDHPAWQALGFSLGDPHRYQYRFQAAGMRDRAAFTVEARGDLDCDGTTSRFRRTARVADGVVHGSGLRIEDELE